MKTEKKKQHAALLMLVVGKLVNYRCPSPSPTASYFPKQKKKKKKTPIKSL